MFSPSTNSKNPFIILFANLLKYINSIIFLFPRRTIHTFQLTLYINSRLFFRFLLITFSSFTKKYFLFASYSLQIVLTHDTFPSRFDRHKFYPVIQVPPSNESFSSSSACRSRPELINNSCFEFLSGIPSWISRASDEITFDCQRRKALSAQHVEIILADEVKVAYYRVL